jgi:hypothetical protein
MLAVQCTEHLVEVNVECVGLQTSYVAQQVLLYFFPPPHGSCCACASLSPCGFAQVHVSQFKIAIQ